MKKHLLINVAIIILFLLSYTACGDFSRNKTLDIDVKATVDLTDNYYTLQDFENLVIGKSTFADLKYNFSSYLAYYTQTGLECEFPTKDGRCIRLSFEGTNLLFQSIMLDEPHLLNDKYYKLEDFEVLKIGVSTIDDFQKCIGRIIECYATSYGLMCELPMKNGQSIMFKFYGPKNVLHSIEVRD